jgi:hypothetical protein
MNLQRLQAGPFLQPHLCMSRFFRGAWLKSVRLPDDEVSSLKKRNWL